MTASFLPKPVTGVNGNGMHTNLSLSKKDKNLFYDPKGEDGLSASGWDFIDRILTSANDICLVLNPSVNAYRRLDPHFEAPNQIKASAINRGAMVRIPIGNERSARIEVPLGRAGRQPVPGALHPAAHRPRGSASRTRTRRRSAAARASCPDNIYDAIRLFKGSKFAADLLARTCSDTLRRAQAAVGRALPEAAGHAA